MSESAMSPGAPAVGGGGTGGSATKVSAAVNMWAGAPADVSAGTGTLRGCPV